MNLLGKLLCYIGLHDWYEGIARVYCTRCGECIPRFYGDDEH